MLGVSRVHELSGYFWEHLFSSNLRGLSNHCGRSNTEKRRSVGVASS
jgi:hypothetical protein